MKKLISVTLMFVVAACAPAGNLVLDRNMRLDGVTVVKPSKEAEAGTQVSVDEKDFRRDLQAALSNAGFAAPKDKAAGEGGVLYDIDANLTKIDFPVFGFNMNAAVSAKYQVKNAETGEVVFSEVINTQQEARFTESFDATERAKLATDKAIQKNITHFLWVLSAKLEGK